MPDPLKGWRRRLWAAFAVGSVIPLLVFAYVLTHVALQRPCPPACPFLVFALLVVLALSGYGLLARHVGTLSACVRYMREIALGNGEAPPPSAPDRDSDFAALLASVTAAVTRLRQDRVQLKELSDTLQAKVAERTAELQQLTENLRREMKQLQETERALQRSRESFHHIVERHHDGLLVLGADGLIRFANAAAQHMLAAEKNPSLLNRTLPIPWNGENPHTGVPIRRTNGNAGIGELRVFETEWEGSPARLVIVQDVTERREAEEAVRQGYVRIEGALRDLSETTSRLVAEASHELRTPLAIIREFSALVHDGIVGPLTPKQKDCLHTVLRNCDRMTHLISNMLDLSRIESGKQNIHRQSLDLQPLLREVVSEWAPQCQAKEQKLVFDIPGVLPAVYADLESVRRILTNLLGNAQKFTPSGGAIRVFGAVEGRFVTISVQDTGPGIAWEDQQRIFQPFYRSRQAEDAGIKGSGLGLSIARNLAQLNGGYLAVESEPGRGSRFFFPLPVYQVSPRHRVLLIDDSAPSLELMEQMLRRSNLDLEVQTSRSSIQALLDIGELQPDLVVLDVHLADLAGQRVLTALRRKPETQTLKILAVSGDPDALAECRDADAVLAKPFSSHDFVQKVVQLLGIERRARRV